jgi:hypothetical protein
MKPNQEPENDPSLKKVLSQWVVDAPLPPRFQEQVWQRIAQAEAKPEVTITFWALLRNLIETNLPRPKLAYSYAAILLAVGMLAGTWAAQAQNTRTEASLGSRYLQSVDPYQPASHGR